MTPVLVFTTQPAADALEGNTPRVERSLLVIPVLFSRQGREQKYEEGITLLRNALANQSDCVLHRMLGDFLVAVNDYQEAMDQYSIALR